MEEISNCTKQIFILIYIYTFMSTTSNEYLFLCSFIPSHCVTSSSTRIWKSQFAGEWDTRTSIPEEDKDIWFNAFKVSHQEIILI